MKTVIIGFVFSLIAYFATAATTGNEQAAFVVAIATYLVVGTCCLVLSAKERERERRNQKAFEEDREANRKAWRKSTYTGHQPVRSGVSSYPASVDPHYPDNTLSNMLMYNALLHSSDSTCHHKADDTPSHSHESSSHYNSSSHSSSYDSGSSSYDSGSSDCGSSDSGGSCGCD